MQDLPDNVKENDLSLQKLLITAYLDKFEKGEATEDVWLAVIAAVEDATENRGDAAKHLLLFAELTAELLAAMFPDPIGTLALLRTFTGTVDND